MHCYEWMIYRTFKGKWVRQPQDNYENELNPCNKVRCIFPHEFESQRYFFLTNVAAEAAFS